jgi:hypothetical protein
MTKTTCFDVFEQCVLSIQAGELIESEYDSDKEFHFQNWFEQRLRALPVHFDKPKRNIYPDFCLVELAEGYEVKGLRTPGRDKTFDSNSQAPSGFHNGRQIFYIFGRYPKKITNYEKGINGRRQYPVIDLVICHGDFLNLDRDYVHKNKHVKGFGSYGDILIRDRKMYVVPTPFALTEGTTGLKTLILPEDMESDGRFQAVGKLSRVEANELVIEYSFNLQTNGLNAERISNPRAGVEHGFVAYRLANDSSKPVSMVAQDQILADLDSDADEADEE